MAAAPLGDRLPRCIATAKLNDVEPFAYLKDVLERMTNGHPMSRLDDLLPWNWTQLKARRLNRTCQEWTLSTCC